MAWVRHHLKVLGRAGAVEARGGCRIAGEKVAYSLSLEGVPDREQEVLLGELSLQTCFRLMAHLMLNGTMTPVELAERTGLHWREVARYLNALHAGGWAEIAPRAKAGNQADRLRGYPESFIRWLRFTTEEDGS